MDSQAFQWLLDENPGSGSKLEGDTCPTELKVLNSRPLGSGLGFWSVHLPAGWGWGATAVTQRTPVLEHSGSSSAYKFINCSYTVTDDLLQKWHHKIAGPIGSSKTLPPAPMAESIAPPLESGQDFEMVSTDGMWQNYHHGTPRARSSRVMWLPSGSLLGCFSWNPAAML